MELPGLPFVRVSLETCLKFHKAGFWAQTKRAVIIIFIVLNLEVITYISYAASPDLSLLVSPLITDELATPSHFEKIDILDNF